MAGIRNKIVLAQKIWASDSYIAYYDNGDAVMFNSLEDDEALQKFVQDCTTAGCGKTVEFNLPINAQSKIKCRQTLYCKLLVVGGNTSVADAATELLNSFTHSGVNYVIWCPTFHRLEMFSGVLNTSKPIGLENLSSAPRTVLDFMQACVNSGYALKRFYRTTANNRVVAVVEYLFSAKKLPKDFRGSDANQIEIEELSSMGFEV